MYGYICQNVRFRLQSDKITLWFRVLKEKELKSYFFAFTQSQATHKSSEIPEQYSSIRKKYFRAFLSYKSRPWKGMYFRSFLGPRTQVRPHRPVFNKTTLQKTKKLGRFINNKNNCWYVWNGSYFLVYVLPQKRARELQSQNSSNRNILLEVAIGADLINLHFSSDLFNNTSGFCVVL
jgi:hypothetical protein